ncbi:hypothetical protein [Kistimonas asteriae]|uniref:hypothetical protein n=1 Tax=Kistimonas asteriae TaxID=517724 RepID=UPI001BA7BDE7|nr:hypothetical protein [Kistimonas asteriae]
MHTLGIRNMYRQPPHPMTPERRKKLRQSLSDSVQSDATKRHGRVDLESMTDAMGDALERQFLATGDFDDGYIPWIHMTDKYTAANMNIRNLTPASSVIRGVPIRFLENIQGDTALLTTSSLPNVRIRNYKKSKQGWVGFHPSFTRTHDIPNKAFVNAFILPAGTDESGVIEGAKVYASGKGEYAVVKVELSDVLCMGAELYEDEQAAVSDAWIIAINIGTLIPVKILARGS